MVAMSGFSAESIPLEGMFVLDSDRTQAWMVEVEPQALALPVLPGQNDESGLRWVHHWDETGLVIEFGSWHEEFVRKWERLSATKYRNTKEQSADDSDLVRVVEIEDSNNYFVEIFEDGQVTREYYTRKTTSETDGEQAEPLKP